MNTHTIETATHQPVIIGEKHEVKQIILMEAAQDDGTPSIILTLEILRGLLTHTYTHTQIHTYGTREFVTESPVLWRVRGQFAALERYIDPQARVLNCCFK